MRPAKHRTWSIPFLGGLAKHITGNLIPWCMPKTLTGVTEWWSSLLAGVRTHTKPIAKPLVVAEIATARHKGIADTHSQTDREVKLNMPLAVFRWHTSTKDLTAGSAC